MKRPFDYTAFLAHLPHQPGVYQMLDRQGNVLYVGKAKDLKKRLASYFKHTQPDVKTKALLKRTENITTIITHNENEALLLECRLIKQHLPRYNIVLRDDKTYPYIVITNHHFPRITLYRGPKDKPYHYFGPYANVTLARETIQLIQRFFHLRICQDSVYQTRERPCLLYQIKRCTGPCVGFISHEQYQHNVQLAKLFLQGKNNKLIKQLKHNMKAASSALQFELAAQYRDHIQHIQHSHIQQPRIVNQTTPAVTNDRFQALEQLLSLSQPLKRIECFDISHTQGEATVASNVVFNKQGPLKSDYRYCYIHHIKPGDDLAAMQQALLRRFKPSQPTTRPLPELLLIDGGETQLQAAQAILALLKLEHLFLVSLSKGPKRKRGEEQLHRLHHPPIRLASHNQAFHLLQQIRDEAHRFAITKHRAKRNHSRRHSQLELIPHIGIKRRQALLHYFGGIQCLTHASLNELMKVPGISQALAKRLFETFHDTTK